MTGVVGFLQAKVWAIISVVLAFDYLIGARLLSCVLPIFLIDWAAVVYIEAALFAIAVLNSLYCYWIYLTRVDRKPHEIIKHAQSFRHASLSQSPRRDLSIPSTPASSSTNLAVASGSSPTASRLPKAEKLKHLAKITAFLENVFASTMSADIASQQSTSFSSILNKDTSLSSTLGYYDSPHSRSISSIYTQDQLNRLLDEDTCDSMVDASTHLFSNSFCDSDRVYKAGIYTALPTKVDTSSTTGGTDDAQSTSPASAFPSSVADVLAKRTGGHLSPDGRGGRAHKSRESSPVGSVVSISSIMGVTSGAGGGKPRRYESDLHKVFQFYSIRVTELDNYELKLRVWLCNTIIRPLVQKIDEVNAQLAEKHASLYLKVGVSSIDQIKSMLSSRVELCNTYLPFVLPYLRIHANQNYLVQRFRTLADNVAMEEFRWNNGSAELTHDENDGFSKSLPWSDRLPTDSELVWSAFCAYMDYHLAPCPNYASGEFFKPFSNVYFLKADTQPTPIHTSSEAFYVRMASTNPPVFEFALNGGADVVVPNKDAGNNFWLVIILFLAHVEKFNYSRIGHLRLSAIKLDILSD